jgi:hypothetical protein
MKKIVLMTAVVLIAFTATFAQDKTPTNQNTKSAASTQSKWRPLNRRHHMVTKARYHSHTKAH